MGLFADPPGAMPDGVRSAPLDDLADQVHRPTADAPSPFTSRHTNAGCRERHEPQRVSRTNLDAAPKSCPLT